MLRDPWWLAWLAPAVAAAAGLHAWGERRRREIALRLGQPATLSRLLPAGTAPRRLLRRALETASLGLCFVALAGPQWGVELEETRGDARQVVLAVDASLSMLAEDVKPSRLEKAKRGLSLLLDALKGQRVGIVAFAGEAETVCPLTTDLDAAKSLLRSLEPGMIPVPGSAVGAAVRKAAAALERYPGTKAVVLLTDGEDHGSDLPGAARDAKAAGVRVFAVGIGSPEGEPIPLKDASGGLSGYKKDRAGRTVVSRLGEEALARLAAETGGAYFRSSPGDNELLEIAEAIARGPAESGAAAGSVQRYRNRFRIPLALAWLLLAAALLVPDPVPAPRRLPGSARAAAPAALAALLLLAAPAARAATAEGDLRRGNRHYEGERYGPALESYAEAGRRKPADPRPLFNAGDALFRLGEYDKAREAFAAAAESGAPRELKAAARYNLGNAAFQLGDFPAAAEEYRRSLRLDPSDRDARHNLAAALRRIKEPPPKGKGGGGPKPPREDRPRPQGSSGSGAPPPSPKTGKKDGMSREDAERLLRAAREREKAAQREKAPPAPAPPRSPQGEDW